MAVLPSPPVRQERAGGDRPKVAFFSADWCRGPQINLGGSDYWRLALPASKLYDHGWDVVFARNIAENGDGRLLIQNPQGDWLHDRDVVVLQRWMGGGTAERILRAREQGQVVINEVDDDYWNFPEGHVALSTTDPEVNSDANREHYRATVAASSLVTASTPRLVKELEAFGPPVRLIRNYIDLTWWKLLPPGDFVGWVGGLPWRGRDLEILRDTVVPWLSSRKDFFYHGGAIADVQMEDKLGYDRVTARPLCQLEDYPRLWEPLKVALIPMEDSSFNRSKSWIKGLEAAARGVPFVCSDHSEYRALGVGRVVEEPGDWVRHLEELSRPDVYAGEVAANRRRAEMLDISHHWEEWATLLMEAVTV